MLALMAIQHICWDNILSWYCGLITFKDNDPQSWWVCFSVTLVWDELTGCKPQQMDTGDVLKHSPKDPWDLCYHLESDCRSYVPRLHSSRLSQLIIQTWSFQRISSSVAAEESVILTASWATSHSIWLRDRLSAARDQITAALSPAWPTAPRSLSLKGSNNNCSEASVVHKVSIYWPEGAGRCPARERQEGTGCLCHYRQGNCTGVPLMLRAS